MLLDSSGAVWWRYDQDYQVHFSRWEKKRFDGLPASRAGAELVGPHAGLSPDIRRVRDPARASAAALYFAGRRGDAVCLSLFWVELSAFGSAKRRPPCGRSSQIDLESVSFGAADWLSPSSRTPTCGDQRVHALEAGRHRGIGSGHYFMMLDVEQTQPALLPEGEADHAADFDQFRFAEMLVHAIPERIVGIEVPRNRFGVSEHSLLTVIEAGGFLEVQKIEDVIFDHGAALVAFTERWLPQYSHCTERET